MAKGDPLYARLGVSKWLTDPRIRGLSSVQRDLYVTLWAAAVNEQRNTLPAEYNAAYLAGFLAKSPEEVETILKSLAAVGGSDPERKLIEYRRAGARITVVNCDSEHKALSWKDPFRPPLRERNKTTGKGKSPPETPQKGGQEGEKAPPSPQEPEPEPENRKDKDTGTGTGEAGEGRPGPLEGGLTAGIHIPPASVKRVDLSVLDGTGGLNLISKAAGRAALAWAISNATGTCVKTTYAILATAAGKKAEFGSNGRLRKYVAGCLQKRRFTPADKYMLEAAEVLGI